MLVTVIVALAVGWWLDHVAIRAQLKTVQDESQKWKVDAEVYAKLLRQSPPTGIDLPHSLIPVPNLPNP